MLINFVDDEVRENVLCDSWYLFTLTHKLSYTDSILLGVLVVVLHEEVAISK